MAEDPQTILHNARRSLDRYDSPALRQALSDYGCAATRRLVGHWFDEQMP